MFNKFLIILLTVIIIILIINQILDNSNGQYLFKENSIITIRSNGLSINKFEKNKKNYKILLWTKYFGHGFGVNSRFSSCEYSNCILSENRNDLELSDALLFHFNDINARDVPKYHLTHQKWILYNNEPPTRTSADVFDTFANHINWTMSYKKDSDVYTPYGEFYKCNKNLKIKNKFEEKKKSIAWFVSRCKTDSQREVYVYELQKYIDVDIYGRCGPFKCDNDYYCNEMIAKEYKFYLSFENSVSFRKNCFPLFHTFLSINFFFSLSIALHRLCDRKTL
jgi:hypothetical protein